VIPVLVVCWLGFAVGTWVLLVGPTQSLAEELSALGGAARPAGWRGLVEGVGERTARLWARMGRASAVLEADLAVRGKTAGTFYGERIAGGLLLLLWVPVMRVLGVHIPLAPVWSLALGAVGFFLPARLVKSKAAEGRQELSDGVAEMAVLMSLAVSAGVGIDAAFRSAVAGAPGRFAEEVARARNAHPRDSLAKAIEDVAERLGLPEAASLAGAVGSTEHGTAVGDALEELAWTMVEERRTEAIEAGVQARIRMLLVASGLIVPGYAALFVLPALRLALAGLRGG
jgi:Flp pilus assembly protein TadB